MENSLLFSVFK